jgi:hypothetical protein
LLVVFCGIVGCAQKNPGASSGPVSAASYLIDLDGKPTDLWSADRPAITVALFTRTDCPISNRYAPEIRRLYEQFHPRGVEFFLIYVDPRQQPDEIRKHVQEYAYPCAALRDPEHKFVAQCGATMTPEAVVFDSNRKPSYRGRIDDSYTDLGQPRDQATTHDLADAIESTLQGRPVANPRTKVIGCRIADLKD